MIFVFIGSTDLMSAEHTSRFIGPFLRWVAPDISTATVESIQFLVRKCAHVAEYAILAALFYRAFRHGQDNSWRAATLALVAATFYASLDEFHQSFVPSRTGTPWDVGIDSLGALAGLVIYWAMSGNPKSKI